MIEHVIKACVLRDSKDLNLKKVSAPFSEMNVLKSSRNSLNESTCTCISCSFVKCKVVIVELS